MKIDLLDSVRCSCKDVAEQSRHVRIAHGLIPGYASSLPLNNAALPELDPATHYLDQGEGTLAFVITLDAINFGSGYFPHLRKRPGMSGYFTVASSLTDYYRENGPLSAEQLAQITRDDCTGIFDQDPSNEPVQELMRLFTNALNKLGKYLLDSFKGSFRKLVEQAHGSAERLVQILIEMPYFKDAEMYNGKEIQFYKRAQLTAADLSLACGGRGPGRFEDLDKLTIFADNLVPHVLRVDGILVYEEHLAARIEAEELIPSGSEDEVEIRACAVHAVELIKEEVNRGGHAITSMGLDYLLWNRGQQPYYKLSKPRHRTRTVFY